MNSENDAVKYFVVNVLGCRCPEEVFHEIRLNRAPAPVDDVPLLFDIRVGGRLLIWGVAAGELQGRASPLAALAAAGARTRDDNGFNRFRLVVVSNGADGPAPDKSLEALPEHDGRIHLHVVDKRDVEGFMDLICNGL